MNIELLRQKYEIEKLSLHQTAYVMGCSYSRVRRTLQLHNITIRTHQELFPDLFTDHPEIMTGLLLGDGYLKTQIGSKNAALRIKQVNQDLVEYLKNYLCPKAKIHINSDLSYFNKKFQRHIKCRTEYIVQVASPKINSYLQSWYPYGKKIVPNDIQLTPLTALNWFYGDGSTSFDKSKRNVQLTLCTNGFTQEDVKFLQASLSAVINFPVNIKKSSHDSQQLMLSVSCKEGVRKFLDYIGPCTVSSMQYKWKYPI